jgi:hypothetical protein
MVAVAFLVLDIFADARFGSICIALSRVAKTSKDIVAVAAGAPFHLCTGRPPVPYNLIKLMNIIIFKKSGSAKANRKEPETYFGRVFNHKLGCYNDVHVIICVDARPHL